MSLRSRRVVILHEGRHDCEFLIQWVLFRRTCRFVVTARLHTVAEILVFEKKHNWITLYGMCINMMMLV
jgi:hypothetical protein